MEKGNTSLFQCLYVPYQQPNKKVSFLNILIADDHCLFLEGLKHLVHRLYPNAVITEASNGVDALRLISEGTPYDLALIDLRLPGMDGFTLLKRLTQTTSFIPVLIISSSEDPADIEQTFQLGSSGFVSKSFTPDELKSAIATIVAGGIYRPQIPHKLNQIPSWADQHQITPRQLEVLRLAKKGKLNNEIAERLYITERTVKAHIAALFESFKAKSRTELVHNANQLGLD